MRGETQLSDRLAVESLIGSLADAWKRGDADEYARRFVPDGTFTNFLGMFFQGRDAFRERHDSVFKTVFKGSTLVPKITTLRFIRLDVAVVDIDAEVRDVAALPSGLAAMPDGAACTKLLMVLVKERGDWWISAYHNVAVATPSRHSFA
jgi:uncharacterized protein (TIGR02246 family)